MRKHFEGILARYSMQSEVYLNRVEKGNWCFPRKNAISGFENRNNEVARIFLRIKALSVVLPITLDEVCKDKVFPIRKISPFGCGT